MCECVKVQASVSVCVKSFHKIDSSRVPKVNNPGFIDCSRDVKRFYTNTKINN